MRTVRLALALLLGLLVLAAAAVYILNVRDESPVDEPVQPFVASREQVARGEYLARAGNCIACHTARGGVPYAGGRLIETPFGGIYSTNLTPDLQTGIGGWSAAHFWRAMHNGRSKDGRLLYPAFPYPNYTHVTREDADAIYAFLRSLPPVSQPNRPNALRFPYDSQLALAVWRALYFAPGTPGADPGKSADWNRGAYLVRGLGHCNACHAPRTRLGGTSESLELSGGLVPMQKWYAPSLASPHEAGVSDWPIEDVVRLLKTGVAPGASVMGPMAEVVFSSTQYLSEDDLRAMAVFLNALPPQGAPPTAATKPSEDGSRQGAKLYEQHCADCHGDQGQGAPGAYPALAGNRAVTMAVPANVIRVVISGGFPPSTGGNPRPFGMPPFGHVLSDAQVVSVVSYIRGAWGNAAPPVTQLDVMSYR